DITIYGDGSQRRTFCYIDDNIDASLEAFYQEKFVNDVVNIGSDKEITIYELAQLVLDITGSASQIDHEPPLKEGDMLRRKPDITKMTELLGRDLLPLEDGIRKVLSNTQFILD